MLVSDLIEKKIKQKLNDGLSANNISGISFMLGWDDTQEIKGEEEITQGIITVKANLPTFETPTIPDSQIETEINFVSRTDADYQGKNYLAVSELIYNQILNYQKSFSQVETDFAFDNFVPTGFRISGSEYGAGKDNGTWILSVSVIIYGIHA